MPLATFEYDSAEFLGSEEAMVGIQVWDDREGS